MYDSLVGLLQIRRAILFFPLCATVGKLVARDSLHWFVHVELTALVQWLMFAIFIAGMLNHRHAFCALILGNWFATFYQLSLQGNKYCRGENYFSSLSWTFHF